MEIFAVEACTSSPPATHTYTYVVSLSEYIAHDFGTAPSTQIEGVNEKPPSKRTRPEKVPERPPYNREEIRHFYLKTSGRYPTEFVVNILLAMKFNVRAQLSP